jgi:uncharacterized RmlC-like cupin family protein
VAWVRRTADDPAEVHAAGLAPASAGSAGIVITLRALTVPSSARSHSHTEADRSAVEVTTPTNP